MILTFSFNFVHIKKLHTMNKSITLELKERNFIAFVLDNLATNGSVSMDSLKVYNYSMKDVGRLRDKVLHNDLFQELQ